MATDREGKVILSDDVRISPTRRMLNLGCKFDATMGQLAEAGWMLERWQRWAWMIKRDAHALYLAARDPRVPWYAKSVAVVVAAYAASPIDLIPDFIPVIGYLDDLIIVPLGIALVIKFIPPELMAEHRALATAAQDRPVSKAAAAIIVAIWIVAITVTAWTTYRYFGWFSRGGLENHPRPS